MLEKALENIEKHSSFVGLLEQFDESLILLQDIYKWRTPFYKTQNKTKARIATEKLDSASPKTTSTRGL